MPDIISSLNAELGESIYPFIRFNSYQEKFLNNTQSQKFVFGGNRSGKTFVSLCTLPLLADGKYKIRGAAPKKRYTVWVSCLDHQLIKQTIIPTLRKVCPNGWLKLVEYKNEFTITGPTGIEVKGFFKSADAGRTKYQSASVDLIILDEEHPESIHKECRARIVDCKGQIINAMTPLMGMTWVYNYSMNHFRITMPTDANKTLSAEDIADFRKSYTDEKELKMRLEGQFVDLAGLKFLQHADVEYLEACEMDPLYLMAVDEGKLVESDYGNVYVYQKPREGARYGIGVDVATGTGNDSTVAVVKEFTTAGTEEVARFRSNLTSIPAAAELIYLLGQHYNGAYYMIEVNGVGIAVKQILERQYNYYRMPLMTDFNNQQFKTTFGFTNTQNTRDALLSTAKANIQSHKSIIRNARAICEWKAFQYIPKKHRYDHLDEWNDDCIFADALAERLTEYFTPPEREKNKGKDKPLTIDQDEALREELDMLEYKEPATAFDRPFERI